MNACGADDPPQGLLRRTRPKTSGCVIKKLSQAGLDQSALKVFIQDFDDFEKFSNTIGLNPKERVLLKYNADLRPMPAGDAQAPPFPQSSLHLIPGIEKLFEVTHRTFWFDDDSSPNAYATNEVITFDDLRAAKQAPEQQDRDRLARERELFDGTVVLGRTLAVKLLKADHDQPHSFISVVAHESAHIRQFKSKTIFSRTKYAELHADYLAGWIVYRIIKDKKLGGESIKEFDEASAFAAMYRIGDEELTSADHHGTKGERLHAFLAGFEGDSKSIDSAYTDALAHVQAIAKKDNNPAGAFQK
jgi:hypothetical protein